MRSSRGEIFSCLFSSSTTKRLEIVRRMQLGLEMLYLILGPFRPCESWAKMIYLKARTCHVPHTMKGFAAKRHMEIG